MNYIESVLRELNFTKEEYIADCKRCFFNEPEVIQQEIRDADIEELEHQLFLHRSFETYRDYCKAIKYEMMLRTDFKVRI